jgi:hypothetical protein
LAGGCCNAHRFADPDKAALAEAIEAAVEDGKPVPADLIAQAENGFGGGNPIDEVVETDESAERYERPLDIGRRD